MAAEGFFSWRKVLRLRFLEETGVMAIAHEWKWEKSHLTSPVTSVEFLGPDLVLSGEKFSYFILTSVYENTAQTSGF